MIKNKKEVEFDNNMAFLIFVIISILSILLSCYFGLLVIHMVEFLFIKDKTFKRFKNIFICTFWQILFCSRKMDKYKWK